ncbi:MAG: TlpA disulfide reductase family protein [Petrimonas sp.]|nr:TlpA disulfide reductase family protein [Petrimonas sp.]
MKKHAIYFFLMFALTGGIWSGCQSGAKKIQVKGEITSVDSAQMLYLEHRGLGGVETVDSVKIDKKGTFRFREDAPQNPEFYQVRLGNQYAAFTVDSAETLHVKADAKDMFNTLVVENSPINDQLRQINQHYQSVAAQIKMLDDAHKQKTLDDMAYLNQVDSALNQYKNFATKLILGNPASAAAYYALFQKVDDYLIFDPYDRKDYAMFGAVATSWHQQYPDTPREKHLYDFTMNALKTRKQQEQQAEMLKNVPVITESAMPDIVLSDVNGNKIALSSLKGKVVLLDFTVYNSEFSPKHNIALNTLYRKYKPNGFEIYQVSFDSDEHLWKNAAINVPWAAVRDPQSVYSALLSTYNVRNLPTAFVVNREGSIVARVEDYNRLEGELKKVL